jgi:hypothetical protein
MINDKFGLNLVTVYVTPEQFSWSNQKKCCWIGFNRFRCGNCRKGYFDVFSASSHDRVCPECDWTVVVAWSGS